MKKWIPIIVISLLISSLTSCDTQIHANKEENSQSFPLSEESAITYSSELPNIGGSLPTTEFKNSFILLPDTLAHIIDTGKLSDWENLINGIVAAGKEDPYLYDNIYQFIRFFDIQREDFEKLYYSTNLYYLYDYNFDLLYSDDIDKVYSYYKEENEDFLKRNTEFSIKQDIKNLIGDEDFNNWLYAKKTQEYGDYYDVSWSIAEVVYDFDIPRSAIEDILHNYMSDENGVMITEIYEDGSEASITNDTVMYEYNLDMVYNDNAELKELLALSTSVRDQAAKLKGYEIDRIIHLP